jgi:TetR/AcrR family transcriptional repressor of bet genes
MLASAMDRGSRLKRLFQCASLANWFVPCAFADEAHPAYNDRPETGRSCMPTADHAERRRRIAKVTVDVIAREGLEAATIRRIAEELNGPTKLVTYYFADKDELLLWAYQSLGEQHERKVAEVVAHDPNDILGILFAMSPIDEMTTKSWRVYLAFWDWAARAALVADLQRTQINLAVQRISAAVRARSPEREDFESISERLNGVVQGLAIQALMDTERWSPERIRARLAEEVAVVLGAPPGE